MSTEFDDGGERDEFDIDLPGRDEICQHGHDVDECEVRCAECECLCLNHDEEGCWTELCGCSKFVEPVKQSEGGT